MVKAEPPRDRRHQLAEAVRCYAGFLAAVLAGDHERAMGYLARHRQAEAKLLASERDLR